MQARTPGTGTVRRNGAIFAGTLTQSAETAAAKRSGMTHGTRFEFAVQPKILAKIFERSPDFVTTAVNKSGRKVRFGTALRETGLREPMRWSLPAWVCRLSMAAKLGGCHAAEPAVTTEAPCESVPVVTSAAAPRRMHRHEFRDLREDRCAR